MVKMMTMFSQIALCLNLDAMEQNVAVLRQNRELKLKHMLRGHVAKANVIRHWLLNLAKSLICNHNPPNPLKIALAARDAGMLKMQLTKFQLRNPKVTSVL